MLWLAAAQSPAQDPSPAPSAPAAPQAPAGNVVVEAETSGLYFEWALTAVGLGLALFVVCRSSRRN